MDAVGQEVASATAPRQSSLLASERRRHVRRLYHHQSARCFYCDGFMAPVSHDAAAAPNGYTVDHVWPLCFGGKTGAPNRVLACRACNHDKGSTMPTGGELLRAFDLHIRAEIRAPNDWRFWRGSKSRDQQAKRLGYANKDAQLALSRSTEPR